MQNTLSEINEAAARDPARFIAECEDAYHDEIRLLASRIAGDSDCRIVMIAGPSASGKTTTAHILRRYLKDIGVASEVVSLDDFYLEPEQQPILPNGKRDIESVNALDVAQIGECFRGLIRTGKTVLPRFDFAETRKIEGAHPVDISGGGIILVEGLHALNPTIQKELPQKNLLRVYISVNLPVSDQAGVVLSSRQIRLIRRIERDILFRDSDIRRTLSLWTNVTGEEERSLYCYKDTADVRLTTLHAYELCVYRHFFKTADTALSAAAENYEYFNRTMAALSRFTEIDPTLVPADSLIREFIGGSSYQEYT